MNEIDKKRLDTLIKYGEFIGERKLVEVSSYDSDIYEGDMTYCNENAVLLEHELYQYNKDEIEKMGLVELARNIVLITDDGYEIEDLYRLLREALLDLTQDKDEIIRLYNLERGEAW